MTRCTIAYLEEEHVGGARNGRQAHQRACDRLGTAVKQAPSFVRLLGIDGELPERHARAK